METAEITKTKKTTFKQVVKAVKAFAAKNGQKFVQVEEHYNCDSTGKEAQSFRAYINGFNIFATANNVTDLIDQFKRTGIKPPPTDSPEDLDLLF